MDAKKKLTGELVRGTLASMGVMISARVLGFVLSVLLARELEPRGNGIYAFVFSVVTLLAIPTQVGLPSLIVRETAKAQAKGNWGLMRGLWRWSTFAVGFLSVTLAALTWTCVFAFRDQLNQQQIDTFAYGIFLIPFVALGNIRCAALRGLRRIVAGQIPETVLRPGLLIVLMLVTLHCIFPQSILPSQVMGLHVVASVLSFCSGAFLLWRFRPACLTTNPPPEYKTREWIAAAFPLALANGLQLISDNASVILLGSFRTTEEVGIYKVAVTGTVLVIFGLQAIGMVVAPHFSWLYAKQDMTRLQRLVTVSSRYIFLLALPFFFVFMFFGNVVLDTIFGKKYLPGVAPLAILAVGQLVNAMLGPVSSLLTMTGFERDMARSVAIATALNVVLGVALIPQFGMIGAAIASTATTITWNFHMWFTVRRKIGIDTMPFGFFRKY